MDWLECMNTYVKVVEEGSFNGAARRLHTTNSAVSKRIHWLENRVGTQLLKRTTRSLSQTEAGALFYQGCKESMAQWQTMLDDTRSVSGSPKGLLRVGATVAVGSKFLVKYLKDFLDLYPEIRIQLTTTDPGQLPEMNLDVFISRELEQLNSLSVKQMPLLERKIAFYAAPSYIELHGCPNTIDELKHHNVLIWGESPEREYRVSNNQRVMVSGNFSTTNPEALFYAGKSGMGIMIVSEFMIEQEVESGQLVRVLPDIMAEELTIYAYYPNLDREHTRTKLFIDYLKSRLEQHQAQKNANPQ
ncbi:LysR family transcriptional regulator [Vibrio agarivorans]|uniref:LysR family transcriptional regulator n=1 Tax=Vibrio agarivorans TaxID=153622 RepID=A0ABT7XY83_9VIBR|nr:LysR family transcriptional regulator [Vibrio agarivorans]MDN2480722.1 LysR family transcriptional regulator [Vibrio agarivorans]